MACALSCQPMRAYGALPATGMPIGHGVAAGGRSDRSGRDGGGCSHAAAPPHPPATAAPPHPPATAVPPSRTPEALLPGPPALCCCRAAQRRRRQARRGLGRGPSRGPPTHQHPAPQRAARAPSPRRRARRGRRAEARAALVAALHGCPCHWGAWQALAALAAGADAGDPAADLPRHWARDFHLAHLALEAQENDEALGRLQARPPPGRTPLPASAAAPRLPGPPRRQTGRAALHRASASRRRGRGRRARAADGLRRPRRAWRASSRAASGWRRPRRPRSTTCATLTRRRSCSRTCWSATRTASRRAPYPNPVSGPAGARPALR